MIVRFLSVLVFLLAAAGIQVYAANPPDTTHAPIVADTARPKVYGVLIGTVTDTTGNPIAGATVLVQGTSRGAFTKADGSFTVLKIPPGTYIARVKSLGFLDTTNTIAIRPNEQSEATYSLRTNTRQVYDGGCGCFIPLADPERIGTIRVISSEQLWSSPP